MPIATASAPLAAVAFGLGVAVLSVAATVSDPRPAPRAAAPAAATAALADPAADGIGADAQDLLRRFALHGLLLPLLDVEAGAARWQDASLALPCGPATQVSVDGAPVPVGSAWSGRAFTVRWQLDDCQAFGPGGTRLHGQVELDVFPENEGLSAIVRVGAAARPSARAPAAFVARASWTL